MAEWIKSMVLRALGRFAVIESDLYEYATNAQNTRENSIDELAKEFAKALHFLHQN